MMTSVDKIRRKDIRRSLKGNKPIKRMCLLCGRQLPTTNDKPCPDCYPKPNGASQ